MSNFSPSKFLDELYNNFYLKNKDEWIYEPDTHNYVNENLSFSHNNERKHYELLRYIIYQSCGHKNDKDYLNFLHQLLFTLLEENAISLEHIVNNKEKLHSLLSMPELNIFDHGNGTIRISNTKVKQLIDFLEKDEFICDKIKQRIDVLNNTTKKTTKRNHPYSKKGGKKKKTIKITKKYHPYSKKGSKNKKTKKRKQKISKKQKK